MIFAVIAAAEPTGIAKILDPIVKILVAILDFGYQYLHNWGWSIVFLTIVVRIVLIPLTWQQFKSMRAMQALQPQIKGTAGEVQGRPEGPQPEDDGVLPGEQGQPLRLLSAASPSDARLLLSLLHTQGADRQVRGIDLALDQGLGTVPTGWIAKDITKFDLILLLLYVGSQFLSSKQMMTSTDPTQKMMMYMMPVVIGVVMFVGRWPAGLFIYWFTSNLWTLGQQYVISKTMPAPAGGPGCEWRHQWRDQSSGRSRKRNKARGSGRSVEMAVRPRAGRAGLRARGAVRRPVRGQRSRGARGGVPRASAARTPRSRSSSSRTNSTSWAPRLTADEIEYDFGDEDEEEAGSTNRRRPARLACASS